MKNYFVILLILTLAACKIPYNGKDVFEEKAKLEIDEMPHTKNSLEWWYFTGHLTDSVQEKTLGVEYVIFHFNPTNVKGGWMLNMAISDPEEKAFFYDHKFFPKKKNQFESMPLDMNFQKGRMQSSFKGAKGNYLIDAVMSKHPITYKLQTKAEKGVVLHDGIGYENYGNYAKAGYYSFPRLATEGNIRVGDHEYNVNGNLWYDRQWNCSGVFDRKVAWDWFAIQFEESQSELMLYRLYHLKDSVEILGGTYTDKNGNSTFLENNQIKIIELAHYRSNDSDAKYPTEWKLEVPSLELESNLKVLMPEQELELKFGVLNFYYWEGMAHANGKIQGQEVFGKSYVEMTNRFRIKD